MKLPFISTSKVEQQLSKIKTEFIDKLNTTKAAYDKASRRESVTAYQSGYQGGYLHGTTAGQKYAGGISGSGSSLSIDHYSMRQNARRATHESLEARAIVESFASNVIGCGLHLDPTPDRDILGITEEQAEEWSRAVASRYDLYANDKKQHRSGTMSWYQYQRLYELKQHRDNDVFTRFYYSSSKKLQNPLQFEGIDANQIRGSALTNTIYNTAHDFNDGIMHNEDGTEKAYKIWVKQKNGITKDVDIPRKSEKTGRILMVHGFQPEYDGQARGFSRLGMALQELENVTDFTLAAIKKAVNQSQAVMSVENDIQTPGNPLQDNVGALSSGVGVLDDVDTGVAGDTATTDILTPNRTGVPEIVARSEATFTQPGSTAFVLNNQGDKVKMLNNGAPGDQFEPLVKNFYDRICAAAGTSSEVVLNIYKNNYTGIRASLVSVWRRYREWRQEIDTDLLAEHYEMWMSGEIAKGRTSAPGWNDPVIKAAWLKHKIIGDPMPQSDPGREAKALKEYIMLGATTQEREAINFNGSSFKDNIAKNRRAFEESPIPFWQKNENGKPDELDKQVEGDQKEEDKLNG